MRPTPNGVAVYGRQGHVDLPIPPGRAFPDKAAVIDELCDAVINDREPVRNGRWGKATMEASLAVLKSAQTRQEEILTHQVRVSDS